MKRLPSITAGLVMGALAASAAILMNPAAAQQATERFIPIGQSPGLSGRATLLGTVVRHADGVLAIGAAAAAAPQQVRVLPETRIWLDRSAQKQSTLSGTVADLSAGRRVEVGFVDPATRLAAAWIKVEAPTR